MRLVWGRVGRIVAPVLPRDVLIRRRERDSGERNRVRLIFEVDDCRRLAPEQLDAKTCVRVDRIAGNRNAGRRDAGAIGCENDPRAVIERDQVGTWPDATNGATGRGATDQDACALIAQV